MDPGPIGWYRGKPVDAAPDPIGITDPTTDEPVPMDWRAIPAGWSDQLTGTDGPRMWDRVVSSESARVQRYHGHATIVLIELDGIERYAGIWGPEAAGRLFLQLARTLATEVRASDHIARVEPTRFAVLLTETDEVAAINFVERVRGSCEKEIRSPELVRVAFRWAGPSRSADLRAAVGIATDRLAREMQAP
jgi:diguanylate cyclase (GGDEF)-like protein